MKQEETREPGSLHFHYNREEREAGLPERLRGDGTPKGFLRGNRSLIITLIDIVVLLLLFGLIFFFGRGRLSSEFIPGYSVSTRALSFQDKVFVTVTIEATSSHASAGNIDVTLSYPDLTDRVELVDVLPVTKGETRELRGSMPFRQGQKEIRVELKSADKDKSYTARIKEM